MISDVIYWPVKRMSVEVIICMCECVYVCFACIFLWRQCNMNDEIMLVEVPWKLFKCPCLNFVKITTKMKIILWISIMRKTIIQHLKNVGEISFQPISFCVVINDKNIFIFFPAAFIKWLIYQYFFLLPTFIFVLFI